MIFFDSLDQAQAPRRNIPRVRTGYFSTNRKVATRADRENGKLRTLLCMLSYLLDSNTFCRIALRIYDDHCHYRHPN